MIVVKDKTRFIITLTKGQYDHLYKIMCSQEEIIDTLNESDDFDPQTFDNLFDNICNCLLYTSPSPRDLSTSRMPSSA